MTPSAATKESSYTQGNVARLELENLERFGEYTRLHFEGQSFSNVEELRYAGRIARVLKSYGLRRGDCVAAMMPNCPQLTAAFHACWTVGAVIVPIIPQWTAGEVANILRSAEPKLVLTVPALAARLHQANSEAATLKRILTFGACDVPDSDDITSAVAGADAIETPVDSLPSDLAALLYTSGTTGAPKGVMLTHETIASAVQSSFRQNPDVDRGVILNALPLTHVFSILVQSMGGRWGCSTILMRQFDPAQALDAIERYQVNYLPAVPTMLMYLLGHPERAKHKLSSLTRIISGGAPLPDRLRQQLEQVFQCRVDQGYGLSESASVATGYPIKEPYRAGSVGRACPGVEIRIVDTQGVELPRGKNGEICLKAANIMTGYWRDIDATREVLRDSWLHTGDIGYLDPDGYLFITDRKKDLIIKGGENISPKEIEDALYLHPAIAEAAVVGVPDEVYGEEICAVIQLKQGAIIVEEEVRVHVGQFVTKFKVPSRIIFQPQLPKNMTGKILKYRIRAQLLSDLSGTV